MNSLLATVNVVTFLPEARLRISGSRVRRPVSRTLFTVRVSFPVGRMLRSRPCVARRVTRRVRRGASIEGCGDRIGAPSPRTYRGLHGASPTGYGGAMTRYVVDPSGVLALVVEGITLQP